jgi:hypothetical protein
MVNGGWSIGPHVIVTQSKKGAAFLRACDKTMTFDQPRAAVRFSLACLDSLFLNFSDAAEIIALLELAGIEARISDMNTLSDS